MIVLPRVYAIVDVGVLGCKTIEAAEALAEGGVGLAQFRCKAHFGRREYEQARAVSKMFPHFFVNDRADIALLLDAGVHVGQTDLPPRDVACVCSAMRVGISTHNEAQFLAAADDAVAYVALGPIFATSTKANPDPVVGIEEFRRLRPEIVKPVVAIGGITRAAAAEVWAAGADSVAVIGDMYPQDRCKAAIRERAEEWIQLAHEYDKRFIAR